MNLELSCNFVDIYMERLRDLGKTLVDSQARSTKLDFSLQ